MRRTHRLSVRLIRWTIRYGFFLLFLSNATLVSAKSNASVSHPSTRNHNLSDGSERGQTASADPRSSVGNAARLFRARDARSLPMGVQESSIIPFLMPIIWNKRLANDSAFAFLRQTAVQVVNNGSSVRQLDGLSGPGLAGLGTKSRGFNVLLPPMPDGGNSKIVFARIVTARCRSTLWMATAVT
jgi:hypothetical protein